MNLPSAFSANLAEGQIGEGEMARWFQGRGWMVLPAYEKEIDTGKGPRLFTACGRLITPDMLVFNSEKVIWVEAKTKTAFTWYRNGNQWQDGIDLLHWKHYCEVADITPWPVWILFLHRPGGLAKDTPEGISPPVGLFGQNVSKLRVRVDHISDRYARGMVYWNISAFELFPEYSFPLNPPSRGGSKSF